MSARILIIDDEESVCEIFKFNLEREGYRVDCAYSAEEALALDINDYDLFIVDIMMGELSGYDLVKIMRSRTPTSAKPVIFCSALDDDDEKVMGLNIGADDYITKPFAIAEVKSRIQAVLRRSAATTL